MSGGATAACVVKESRVGKHCSDGNLALRRPLWLKARMAQMHFQEFLKARLEA